MLQEIDELYAQAQALESAAEVATVMAVRAGASPDKLAEALQVALDEAPEAERDRGMEQARRHLEGRRCICRAVTRLALEQGIEPELLMKSLREAGEEAARLRYAVTPSDLGL